MTNVVTPPQTPAKTSKARRSVAADAVVVRAKATLAALPALLAGIAAKDAKAAKVRIDQAWVDEFTSLIATAEEAEGTRAVATVTMKAVTAEEHQKALALSLLLTDVRDLVATHNPDDLAAQQAYGRGEKIDPRRPAVLANIAGAYLAAWDGKWKVPAVDAGITQATMDQIQAMRGAIASVDLEQRSLHTSTADDTVGRAAALTALKQMMTFAVKVVANVFGRGSSQLRSLSDPRPLTNRASAKAKTKAKAAAVKTAKKAKKTAKLAKPGARTAAAERRAKRATVKARAKALVSAKKPAAKAKKPAAKAKTAKRPATKAKKGK